MIININSWPGVGKLTIARHLQALIGSRLLDNHSFMNRRGTIDPAVRTNVKCLS